jgi:hypothetical protein
MPEQLANNAASTLNGAVDNVVTSWTVANGSVFPATGNFRVLCDSEIALCTARAANVLTVTRGQETTSAASHSNGAAVTHVLTKGGLDAYAVVQTLADAKGDIIAATGADVMTRLAVGANATVLMADSTQATGLTWGGAWQTYVPTWGSLGTAPALGNGVLTARYAQIGKSIIYQVRLVMGSTTTFGTSTYTFTVPVTAANTVSVPGGSARLFDNSSSFQGHGHARIASSTTIQIEYVVANTTGAAAAVAATLPWTWAVSDAIDFSLVYEAA